MPKLEIVLANPEVRRVDRPAATWLLVGCDEYDAVRLEQSGNDRDEIEAEICARVGDATIIKVVHSKGQAHRVSAWRGPTSVHEVFRLERRNGDLIIADHFLNLLARLPMGERTPSDDAIIDHFIFRATPGHNTYCQRVARLGHGERISIELNSGQSNRTLFHRFNETSNPRKVSEYLDHVDHAFEKVLTPFKDRDDVATLFSGGIDSTLLHTYLGSKAAALNLVVDVKDATSTMESEYAKSAADSLGITLHRQEVRQSEFLSDLELATENTAMPVHNGMLPVLARAFSNGYDKYIVGWNAGDLFGESARFNRVTSWLANPLVLRCLELSAPALARKDLTRRSLWRERLEKLLPAAREMSMHPESILGLGARWETYTDFDVAEMIFGEEAISRRLEKRLEYVSERVALSAPHGNQFLRHLEVGFWVGSLCRDFTQQLRHLGMASGKSVLLPYYSGSVVRSAHSIPADERYIRGLEGKYILKRLLKRRLQSYPVGQRKGSTALAPFPRYYTAGPLSRIWDAYEMPDFIEGEAKKLILSLPLNTTYSAVSYAIWKRRVLENRHLEPLPSAQRYEWPYSHDVLGSAKI
jgi:asparagine synthetase B (glutamine-hydrolysing)